VRWVLVFPELTPQNNELPRNRVWANVPSGVVPTALHGLICRPETTNVVPETRYAKTADGVHIGYQVVGSAPIDLVFVPYDYSNIETSWDWPVYSSFVRALASRARVMLFDRRGTGTSDRAWAGPSPTIEARMDDIRAVMDAAGSEQACLFGIESGASLCFLFAATYPERTSGVIVFAGSVRGSWAPDYPSGWTDAEWDAWHDRVEREWGSPGFVRYMAEWLAPSLAGDERHVQGLGKLLRLSASPGDAEARDRAERDTDVRHLLPTIQVPTLVIHRTGDKVEPVEQGRYIAEHTPGATLLELPGEDHIFPMDDLVPHIGRFLETLRVEQAEFDRVLATVLFTDIVGSTEMVAELGDRAWKELLDRHHSAIRSLLGRFRGVRSTPPATGSWPHSMAPLVRSGARWRSWRRSGALAWRCAQAFTRARSSSRVTTFAASPFTSVPEWLRSQAPGRWWSRAR
jgi:pimeloyl-ACP methyl ester carboxylesterase